MFKKNDFTIRKVEKEDLENLKMFFVKAYGEDTVFQNEEFLKYYFRSEDFNKYPFRKSLIAINTDGVIISHYGGIQYNLSHKGEKNPVVWGVNAYTLPEWRGMGINSRMVKQIFKNNLINAVIGMPFYAPEFYEKNGYNIFNKETLDRYILLLDDRSFDVVSFLGQDIEKAKAKLNLKKEKKQVGKNLDIVELTKENFEKYEINLENNSITTTHRDKNFLYWRVFNNPYIDYKVFGYFKNEKIVSYIVIRKENLEPLNISVSRIVDLFGDREGIHSLLERSILYSISNNSYYIDFSVFGNLYEKELFDVGFDKLKGEDVSLLPMVTSPVEKRPNHEFIVLSSMKYNNQINSLFSKDVYFTRIDGDRDRIAKIYQVKEDKLLF